MEKKSRTVLIVVIVILVMLLIFEGVLFFLNSQGYLKFNKEEVTDKDSGDENNTKVDEDNNFSFDVSYTDEEYILGNVTNKRNLPVITSDKYQDSADKIVNSLTELSNKEWESLKEDTDTYQVIPYKVGVSYIISTIVNKNNIVSFKFELGGAYGGVTWADETGYNYLVNTGQIIHFDNILSDINSRDNIYNLVLDDILLEHNEDKFWNNESSGYWKDIVKNNMFNDGRWYFTDNGIRFTFEKYSLGPGSVGVVTSDIGYDIINQYLKDEYKG